ncbi:histidine phosphatase family protein [Actinoplanes sp. LDG1-06]|uniref:Histidine phosphatase family protein n=1 Tax=Paractinoplanes ovalisporus TaxID=2810368 RepID=A0ABS2A3Z4_9ACTN|nr:histidine phosphatase family protein [Actinoplanes ovalisporus]MBM2614577.1 histidine phosphatase family protein [Actinoplanes ovalisporus]
MFIGANVTVILAPHCASVPRDGWAGEQDDRPLSSAGHEQARALAEAVGTHIDAICTSPALRCRQTVEPLAARAGLELIELPELREASGFDQPAEWVNGVFAPMGEAIAGAWIAGQAWGALARVVEAARTTVACSHGDVIPLLLAALTGAYRVPVPPLVERGGWYTLRFAGSALTVTAHTGGAANQ